MIENKNVKKLAWVAVALVIMVLSMTVVSKAASNPENQIINKNIKIGIRQDVTNITAINSIN